MCAIKQREQIQQRAAQRPPCATAPACSQQRPRRPRPQGRAGRACPAASAGGPERPCERAQAHRGSLQLVQAGGGCSGASPTHTWYRSALVLPLPSDGTPSNCLCTRRDARQRVLGLGVALSRCLRAAAVVLAVQRLVGGVALGVGHAAGGARRHPKVALRQRGRDKPQAPAGISMSRIGATWGSGAWREQGSGCCCAGNRLLPVARQCIVGSCSLMRGNVRPQPLLGTMQQRAWEGPHDMAHLPSVQVQLRRPPACTCGSLTAAPPGALLGACIVPLLLLLLWLLWGRQRPLEELGQLLLPHCR